MAMRQDPPAAHLSALVTVARLVNDGVGRWEHVAEVAAQAAILVADAAAIWVQRIDEASLHRIAATHNGPPTPPADASPEPEGQGQGGLIEAVIESGNCAVVDAQDVPSYSVALGVILGPWAAGRQITGAAVLPMRSKGLAAGVLAVARDSGAAFTATQIEFLEALAEITAVTLGTVHVLHGSALAVEEMRQQAELVEHVSDTVVAWDNHSRIITWNAAAENVYGYSSGEALGCDADALLDTRYLGPGDQTRTYAELLPELTKSGSWRGELRQRRIDGSPVELLCSLTLLPGEPGAELPSAVAISQDVTKERGEEREALNDVLTGLPNRRYLLRYLTTVVGRARPHDEVVAVLFLDLDGFKRVNDTMGHDAGDEVLRVVAARFIEALRRDDVVARLGGDEFVAVCRSVTDRGEAMRIGHRLIASAGRPIPIGDDHAQVIPSIGIVVLGEEPGYLEADLSPMDILRRADAAMYVAKRGKRGPVIAD